MNWNEMIDVDLPSLQSIQLGNYALCGRSDESCFLRMRSNNEMIVNDLLCRSSKTNINNKCIFGKFPKYTSVDPSK